jgi:glycosyltransferase involved in cell wall biosynthesis
VADDLLASLYRRALALAFPSLYEGFGLPLVEAMALGTPVLTSNFGAMLEVAGGAAELVDPYDVASIRNGLQRLADEPGRREELRQLGLRRAAEFSWERTARATLAAYGAAMHSPS